MRDLFYQLNKTGIDVDISTFFKACKNRQGQNFSRIYVELMEKLKRQRSGTKQMLFPIDSTVIPLTSKLFAEQKYHQVKLLNGLNLTQRNPSECLIHFGQGNDAKFLDTVTGIIPDNAVDIMDRGFARWDFLEQMSQAKTLFLVRIRNNMKTEVAHERYQIVCFCDLESKVEYRLATNLKEVSNEEVGEIYRQRWQIELLWKFLKTHLKLDKLITKSVNGVTIQIYMVLIAYIILQLIEIPEFYGHKLIDKLRYLQLELRHCGSIIHWSYDLFAETLIGCKATSSAFM